ncbi:sugar ABC transporter ATPase/substrate-binding protein [Candidatus Vecturithrix granuli]|uniref:Sugar ABC transporter ATPase/substrate-binding protein n=1 Tax=Vecturithrix granuli TaxID=1499967 RepID=A0A0S6W7E1_VECG1|nr:sugar ABC transporter ATPase/substrate-binding protein [Candidatus Vecturithrix granuli]
MADEFLVVKNVSKAFAGVQALDRVSVTIRRGEIRCLVGENGSGKSTLIKVISGFYKPDDGEIILNNHSYKRLHPIDAIRQGIQIIYQDFSLFPNLTVAENLALNYELEQNARIVHWKEVRQIAREAIDRIEVEIDLDAYVEDLSVADKQLVAIARAILHDAKLIIMDEPTTALTHKEVESLFQVIKNFQKEGISTLFVSHKLREVLEISEQVTILRNGKNAADGAIEEFDRAKLVYYMTGREIDDSRYQYSPRPEASHSLFSVQHLTTPGRFEDISFEMLPGEIVGITGLLGSGRTALASALFGLKPAESGTMAIEGKPVQIRSVQQAIHHGIGYVPEDRLTEGLFLEQSIGRNIIVSIVERLANLLGIMNTDLTSREIQKFIDYLRIKTPSSLLPVQSLSGGNQQRVVLAKWLAAKGKILILNGPTVGVDIGSKMDIHHTLRELARQGMGIVIISDDIPELLQNCNRIFLMHKGRFIDELLGDERCTEEELTRQLAALVK